MDQTPAASRYVRLIPFLLTTLRLFMAPAVLLITYTRLDHRLFLICLIVAVVSDIYDGIIARRLGIATPALRRYDSITDVIFYLCVLFSAWALYPAVIHQYAWAIAAILALEVISNAVSFARFRRPQATHCYTAKLWGLMLFASMTALLAFGYSGALLLWTIVLGLIVELEVLAILLIVPRPSGDIPSLFHAWRLRRRQLGG